MADAAVVHPRELPVGTIGHRASGWWGMLAAITTEAAIFAYLLFSYYYLAIQLHTAWPPGGPPSLKLALPNTIVLLASSVAFWWADKQIKRGNRFETLMGLLGALGLGVIFVVVQLFEWRNKTFTPTSDLYGSVYFTVTGFHLAHVAVGLAVIAALALWTLLGYFDERRNAPVSIGSFYWHFVDAVWLAVFFTFYITPYLS